jgi:hypothetical protein
MTQQALVTDIPRPSGSDIIIVKLPQGGASSRWLAQRVVNAIRAKVPLGEMSRDVVVLNHHPSDPPLVFGTSAAAERYVAALLTEIEDYPWRTMELDW